MLKSKFLIFVLFIIVGYFALDYFYFSGWKTNISDDPAIKPWINREFELQQEAFLYKYEGESEIYINVPIFSSRLCNCIEYFERNPKQPRNGSDYWLYRVDPGTKLRITRVYQFTKPAVGPSVKIEVQLYPPENRNIANSNTSSLNYQKMRVFADFLFLRDLHPPIILGEEPDVLKRLL